VNANIKIAESSQRGMPPSSVYNVGGNKPVSICSIIEKVESITGFKIKTKNMPVEDGDPKNTGADIDLIRHEINWEPQVPLVDGLNKQVLAIESGVR
jgi:UDP-glucose 4-epimerase